MEKIIIDKSDSKQKFQHKIFEKPKLGYELLNETNDFKNVIIKSDTGTGKSTTIKHFLKDNNHKFISITSRKTLALEHYRIFKQHGIECQVYTDKNLENDISTIFQLESLQKLFYIIEPEQIKDYVLIIDEVNSFIQHLISSPTITQRDTRQNVMANVQTLLKCCKKVIVVDATISESVFKFMKFWNEEHIFIENTFQNNNEVKAIELDSYEKLKEKLLKLNKFMVCCDSANKSKALYKELNDKNIKLITADINEKEIELIDLDKYDKIIFSPKIIYGLDSQIKRDVFCYYTTRTIDAIQMYQQLSRTRNIKKLWIYFTSKPVSTRKYQTMEDIVNETIQIRKWIEQKYELIGRNKIYDLIEELKNIQKFKSDKLQANIFLSFIEILSDKGFKIKQSKTYKQDKTRKSTKEVLKEYHQEIYNYEKNIINKFLKLDENTAQNNIELLSDGYKLLKHIHYIDWVNNNDDNINSFVANVAFRKFPDELIKSSGYKMVVARKWIKLLGGNKEKIKIKNVDEITDAEFNEIVKEFKLMYPKTTVKKFEKSNIIFLVKQLLSDLLPVDTYKKVKSRSPDRKTQSFYLIYNNEVKSEQENIYSFRKEKEIDFVDDNIDV